MALKLPLDWIPWTDALRDTPIARELSDARLRRGPLRLLPRTTVCEGVVLDQHIREGRFQRSLALIARGSARLGAIGNED